MKIIDGELWVFYTDGKNQNLGSVTSEATDSISMLEFTVLSDGTLSVAIKDESKVDAENIVIPSTYNGRTVTAIEENGFAQCHSLETITIPETVTKIGQSAFFNCNSLRKIKIPDNVTRIEVSTFTYCCLLYTSRCV